MKVELEVMKQIIAVVEGDGITQKDNRKKNKCVNNLGDGPQSVSCYTYTYGNNYHTCGCDINSC